MKPAAINYIINVCKTEKCGANISIKEGNGPYVDFSDESTEFEINEELGLLIVNTDMFGTYFIDAESITSIHI